MKKKQKHDPPVWPLALLRTFIRSEYLEEIEGDMAEIYRDRLDQYSPVRAKWQYLLDVVLLFRISLIKKIDMISRMQHLTMFQSYLKSGWRSFLKYRTYSLINILGLSIGFTASLILFLIIRYENSFDRFHQKSERIYKVGTRFANGEISDNIVTPQVPLMTEEYTDIVRGSRFFQWEDILQSGNDFVRISFHLVDSSFAAMFDFPALNGQLKDALENPGHIVLTETLARKIFGEEDAVGKQVNLINMDQQLLVAAVVSDPPKNSTLQFESLIPWSNAPELLNVDQMGNWYNTFMTGYVELAPGSNLVDVESQLSAFKQKYFLEERRATTDIVLLPLSDEHFRTGGSKRMLTILGVIALAILLISCFNFMNLSVSQLLQRTREIGVRKVMGSKPGQLIFQFVSESLIVCGLAVAIGMIGAYLSIPMVSDYFDIGIELNTLGSLSTILFLLVICFTAALLSSSWPSIMLSGLKSVQLIKDAVHWNKSGGLFRRTLLVLQFSVSIFLIIGTLIIWRQIQFMKNEDLKFDGGQVVTLEYYPELFKSPEEIQRKIALLRDELAREPSIESISIANSVPGRYSRNYNTFSTADSANEQKISLRQLTVDHHFFNTFSIRLIDGRDFNGDLEQDKHTVVINETAMKRLGWQNLQDRYLKEGGDGTLYKVIGAVEDYHYQSLKEFIEPLIHFYHPDVSGAIAARLHPERISEGLSILETRWSALDPFEPFHYSFVDESFDKLYKEQQRLGTTSAFFSFIAIVLAGLGLFSLSAYSIRLRRKEIGIRKILGAPVYQIVAMLSGNFALLIMLGFIIACPVIYYLMQIFLQDFAYRIPLTPGIFLMGGMLVVLCFMGLVAMQSARAAGENPVISIREE